MTASDVEMLGVFARPEAWAALAALVTMEIVLGIDNLIFISIVTGKLPPAQQPTAQRIGIGLALVFRLVFLAGIAWIVGLTAPVFDLGIVGPDNGHGEPSFETRFSWRDLILIGGGLFLVWKSTREIHHKMHLQASENKNAEFVAGQAKARAAESTFAAVIVQIIALDVVFSLDSILTAIGMTTHLPIMVVAVIIAVGVMFFAAKPVGAFVNAHPTVVMLALAFLLMIGMVLIADGFGFHVPKGYVYAAMAFAAFVEALNLASSTRRAGRHRA